MIFMSQSIITGSLCYTSIRAWHDLISLDLLPNYFIAFRRIQNWLSSRFNQCTHYGIWFDVIVFDNLNCTFNLVIKTDLENFVIKSSVKIWIVTMSRSKSKKGTHRRSLKSCDLQNDYQRGWWSFQYYFFYF